jgi:MazG family protein
VSAEIPAALARLDSLTRQLRAQCPWDREQDERSIVPHTLEEAYELADAATARDDAKLLDELGDVLFQVHFLSLLLEERGAGDLAQVADGCREKLIRRHPHVFPEAVPEGQEPVEATDAGTVLRNWDRIKSGEQGREAGIFGEVPENLPALLLARKVQRRAASAGFDVGEPRAALDALEAQVERLSAAGAPGAGPTAPEPGRTEAFDAVGDLLFAAVSVARKLKADPELALRASAARFREAVEHAERLAQDAGARWADLPFDAQLAYYAQARLKMENR